MDRIGTSDEIDHHRRRFFGTAAMTIAAAQLGMIGSAAAQSGKARSAGVPAIKAGTHTSFGAVRSASQGSVRAPDRLLGSGEKRHGLHG
jgi:hypothetical protein